MVSCFAHHWRRDKFAFNVEVKYCVDVKYSVQVLSASMKASVAALLIPGCL